MTKTRCNSGREAFGLGVANVVAGLLGGMGGNAMIAHSMLQVAAGGKYRLANIVVGVRRGFPPVPLPALTPFPVGIRRVDLLLLPIFFLFPLYSSSFLSSLLLFLLLSLLVLIFFHLLPSFSLLSLSHCRSLVSPTPSPPMCCPLSPSPPSPPLSSLLFLPSSSVSSS